MSELIVQRFEEEVIEMLKPKIKSVLRQTNPQNREDLEQDLILMVLTAIKEKDFKQIPSFFELMEEEKNQNYKL
ncbi:hypothetical protein LSPCS325_53500 [Lysinibacillus sp. CTST325]|uniref:hypothetical protein n=1 Tax=Lysinibacillus xylanilyticus TaxID=582475 RepID=UPI002B24AB6F|nr:hypothetical protein [Lysinibacillus xylanilyticus]MEB2282920.1 hypothetical protein [Lysinibacillus xylanilyticus]